MEASGQLARAFVTVTAWGLHRGRHCCYPVINCEEQRLVRESICAERKMCGGDEGAYSAGPLTCIPNSSPSLVRFNESQPQ
jgi:hypothetical protein